ncbi:MAG: hypothetical protein DRI90_24755 [Deltaproteobacteria bacterium]|nr:MAG: hypothetical protein DRI90_24755 [Deltaproteobacteria bacterium]
MTKHKRDLSGCPECGKSIKCPAEKCPNCGHRIGLGVEMRIERDDGTVLKRQHGVMYLDDLERGES